MATTSPSAIGTTGTTAATSPTAPKAPTVLRTGSATLGESMLLAELQAISATLSKNSNPIKSQEIWNFLLQFFGIFAATIFGIFSILSWIDANTANSIASGALNLATEANTLALLAYCQSSNNTSTTEICTIIQNQAVADITSILVSLPSSITSGNGNGNTINCNGNTCSIGNGDNGTAGGFQKSSGSNVSLAGLIAGCVIGGILVLCTIVWLPMQTYKEKVRRSRV